MLFRSPQEIEAELQDLLIQCRSDLPVVRIDYGAKLDTLIAGNMASKEKAVSVLHGLNLRDHHDHVQALLADSSLLAEFKGELILELIRQRVDEDYQMVKDGMMIEFNPSLLTNDSYIRYAYTGCEENVVLDVKGTTVVLSGKDSESTEEIYRILKEKTREDS